MVRRLNEKRIIVNSANIVGDKFYGWFADSSARQTARAKRATPGWIGIALSGVHHRVLRTLDIASRCVWNERGTLGFPVTSACLPLGGFRRQSPLRGRKQRGHGRAEDCFEVHSSGMRDTKTKR